MRNILLFSAVVILLASCKEQEFSKDEPLIPELRPALYISGQNNFLYALDPKSGIKIWERFFGLNNILQEPIVVGEFALVNTDSGIIRLNADKGTIIDSIVKIGESRVSGIITAAGDIVYTGTVANDLVAYNFVKKAAAWTTNIAGASTISMTGSFYGNLLIIAIGNTIYAMNKGAGSEVAWTYASAGPFNNPVIAPPNMYVLDKTGILNSLSLETGFVGWNYPVGAPSNSSPIVYGGNIIFGADDNRLYCIDSIAHAPRWVFVTNERIKGSAYADGQVVYFGGYDHYVYAIDIIDGELKWRYRTGALINSSPIVNNGIVYFASYDQHLYSFDTTGALRWKFKLNAPVDMSPVINNLENKVVYPAVSGLSSQ